MDKTEELGLVFRNLQNLTAVLSQDPEVIRRFFDSEDGFIKKQIVEDSPRETHTTCTAFCLHYLANSGLLSNRTNTLPFKLLLQEDISLIINTLGKAIQYRHRQSKNEEILTEASTATAPLPNQYNSSIEVAGYLCATRKMNVPVPSEAKEACSEIIGFLLGLAEAHGGYIPRLPVGTNVPSPYFTYWTCSAFREWAHFGSRRHRSKVKLAITKAINWAESELASNISYHYSGISSRFDIIELAYAALILLKFGDSLERKEMVRHGLSILFKHYFKDGYFLRSAPVFSDQKNFSLLVPTVEILALLLCADLSLFYEFWPYLCKTYDWLIGHREEDGWCTEYEGRHGKVTSFMTSSAVVFMSTLSEVLDGVLSRGAAELLDVPSFAVSPKLSTIPFPKELGRIISLNVLQPLWDGRKDLAAFSLILFGPPGTAKTTIAKKIAQELEWPILVINQSDFLKRGVDNIDAEANRIFQLVAYLKDTVILFDEVDELVGDRQVLGMKSRLLTSSMLPRIHYLRDRERVVFIFATNRISFLDSAVYRLGRFDIIQAVMPPTHDERKIIVSNLLAEFSVSPDVAELFETCGVVARAQNFCYRDLKDLVRRVVVSLEYKTESLDEDILDREIRIGSDSINKSEIEEFERLAQEHHRP